MRILRRFATSHVARFKIAIVGAGPGGFYTAHHLLQKSKHVPVKIDFFDRLPAPFGLSRYGVAPDHPEVKNCEDYMEKIMAEYPDRVRFFGNVSIGHDVPLTQLDKYYHAVVLAYGCAASDNKLSVEGSDLPGVVSARQFVNWYNGHPDSASGDIFNLQQVEYVTIVGNGNVAIDVARVLLADPSSHWAPTDMATTAVDLLTRSSVKGVTIVARRGLLESAFTNKEIRELLEVSKSLRVKFNPINAEILDAVRQKSKTLGRVHKRKFTIIEKASTEKLDYEASGKEWSLQFLLSPKKFIPSKSNSNLLLATVFEENELVEDTLTNKVSVKPTGKEVRIKNDLVILSIGYEGTSLKGFDELGLSFSKENNCIANNEGRLISNKLGAHHKEPQYSYKKGWYASGWIKSGPRGVIATTMMESFDTAEKILEDLSNDIYNEPTEGGDIESQLPPKYVSWQGWKKIEAVELKIGKSLGKTRNKIRSIPDMIQAAEN